LVSTIREVDFCNFSYLPSCLSGRASVRVHNGSFYGHTRGASDGYDFLDLAVIAGSMSVWLWKLSAGDG